MSIFDSSSNAPENTQGNEKATNADGSQTVTENKTADDKPASNAKVTDEGNGKVTLTNPDGSQVTNVPKDKADPSSAEKKVEYPKEILDQIPEKFRSAADPLKAWQEAHKGLEGKLREGKPEAPGEYKVNLPKSATDAGIELNEKDPRYVGFLKLAKEKGFSQDQFDAAISSFFEGEVAILQEQARETEKLGKDGPTMLRETAQRLTRHVGEAEAQAILGQITTAEGAKALSKLVGMVGRETSLPGSDTNNSVVTEQDDLKEYRERLKDPKMKSDKDFRNQTLAMGEKLKGLIDADIKARGVIGSRNTA